jgi:predicted homoserine dehydrogenase-like protein
MIIADKELERREQEGKPIRVGIVGAGYMGRGIALQLLAPTTGMRLGAISNRTLSKAQQALRDAGVNDFKIVDSVSGLEQAVSQGKCSVAEDPLLLCDAANIDVIVDATSDMDYGARVALRALERGKHVILLNAIVDSTIGPILKTYADRNNLVITYSDGDEPGVAVNLFRLVKTIGYHPVAAGNLKGLLDPYRTPDTQRSFAERANQSAHMITSYADGTKLSMECTILANATGLKAGKRGMYGPRCGHVKEAVNLFPPEQLLNGGLVDFLLGAEPHTGAFVIGYNEHPINKQYMSYFKMGDGPFYAFYTPFHLPHLQVLGTIARAVLFHDATAAPLGKPVCDVLTVAKRDLKAGQTLDGMGGFTCYGLIDNSEVVQRENLLPIGLAEGCRLKRAIAKDQPIACADVEVPAGRLCDTLRAEQDQHFAVPLHA